VADPIISPDGKWMWTGREWIPAPPIATSQTINVAHSDSIIEDNVFFNKADDLAEPTHFNREIPTIKYLGTEYSQSFHLVSWSVVMIILAFLLDFFDGIIGKIILVLGGYEIIECMIISIIFHRKNRAEEYSLPMKINILTLISICLILYLMIDNISALDNPDQYGLGGDRKIGATLWLIGALFVIIYAIKLSGLKWVGIRGELAGLRILGDIVEISQGRMPQTNTNAQAQRLIQPCQNCSNNIKTLYRFNKCGRVLCMSCSGGFTCKHCIAGCVATLVN
jgi:hypothetical protein